MPRIGVIGGARNRIALALLSSALAGVLPGVAGEEPELVGPLTRRQIEDLGPEWVRAEVEAAPDVAAAAELVSALAGSEVTVFLGTWCSDSRRELARLWRALDEAGVDSPVEIRYVGVDRDKLEPRELTADQELQYVPTIIVRRNGRELGRIVEQSPEGIEIDLLAILRGERAGWVSTRDDLGGDPPERERR